MTENIEDPAQRVLELLDQISRTEFPRLVASDCDGEIVFRCPTCGYFVQWGDLSAVGFIQQLSYVEGPGRTVGISGGTVLFERDIYGGHDSALWYKHIDHPVALPLGWRASRW